MTLAIALLISVVSASAGPVAASGNRLRSVSDETQASAPTSGGFDWNKWAAVVNENPCGWLTPAVMSKLGVSTAGQREVTRMQTRCVWRASDGGLLLSASVMTWESAANLAAERESQKKLARDMATFQAVAGSRGTVTAVHRLDRGQLTIFPNSNDETAAIVISGHPVRGESEEIRTQRLERAEAFATALIATYGL